MKKYIFSENIIDNEYRYIFLCGTKFDNKNDLDKRIILRNFLENIDKSYKVIILEENFVFAKNNKKYLVYDDIHMKDLYQVEMLTNYMSDNNIIIHESISTGAEVGLFLSEKLALKKTCLLVPDEIAVEEDKLGAFLRLAFLKNEPKLKFFTFYPRVERNIVSEFHNNWHTFFYNDIVGKNLGNKINRFITSNKTFCRLKFSGTKGEVEEGVINYYVSNKELTITAVPRILMICIAVIFNIEEIQKGIINAEANTIGGYIEIIKEGLMQVFINTIEEKTGKVIEKCSVKAKMNISGVYISHIIGMSLYLFQAANFINIVKEANYRKTKKVIINRRMLGENGESHFFYDKYADCIDTIVDNQIIR